MELQMCLKWIWNHSKWIMFVSDLLLNLTKINICSNQSNILSFKNSIFHFFTISKYRDTYPVSTFLFVRYVFRTNNGFVRAFGWVEIEMGVFWSWFLMNFKWLSCILFNKVYVWTINQRKKSTIHLVFLLSTEEILILIRHCPQTAVQIWQHLQHQLFHCPLIATVVKIF